MDRSESLYDVDFHAWTQEQARRLRDVAEGRSNLDLDWANLAEEIESMGSEQRHAVASAIRLILLHLLKLMCSPASRPRPGWIHEVNEYRAQLRDRLQGSPGLKPKLPELFDQGWRDARRAAMKELAQDGVRDSDLPDEVPFSLAETMDFGFFPANRHGLS